EPKSHTMLGSQIQGVTPLEWSMTFYILIFLISFFRYANFVGPSNLLVKKNTMLKNLIEISRTI
ncbi:hypothetical protein L9F63_023780, partial [Diploptera punctata]